MIQPTEIYKDKQKNNRRIVREYFFFCEIRFKTKTIVCADNLFLNLDLR